MEKKLTISFGALSKDFKTQLEKQGYTITDKQNEYFNKLDKYITTLFFSDILTNSAKEKCFDKLSKQIFKSAEVKSNDR